MRHEIIPSLRYTDAQGAIAFLQAAFGFEVRAIYADDADPRIVHHAQLVWQDRMLMLSSAVESDYSRKAGMKTVADAGGATSGLYLVVEDVDGHARQSQVAGADIIFPPADQDYGGRGYSARDPEGNLWSFGSYDPWDSHAG